MVLEKVKITIRKYGLLEKKDKVLIASSGGPDSVCLLHALLALQQRRLEPQKLPQAIL
jgi:tRNA(Ile)-lysidine synthase